MRHRRRERRIKYLSRHFDVWEPDLNSIYNFVIEQQKAGKKRKSITEDMICLESWFEFLGKKTSLPRLKKEPSPEPRIPTDEEIQQIWSYIEHIPEKGLLLKYTTIFGILIYGGVRIGELHRMNVEDITESRVMVRSEKLEKDRMVGLPDDLLKKIREYISSYRATSDQHALITTLNGRATYAGLRHFVRKVSARPGMKWLHAHSFRHYCATSLLKGFQGEKPLDLRWVQIHLRHARIETTTIYTHLSQKDVAEEVRKRYNALFRNEVETMKEGIQKHLGDDSGVTGARGFGPLIYSLGGCCLIRTGPRAPLPLIAGKYLKLPPGLPRKNRSSHMLIASGAGNGRNIKVCCYINHE